MFSNHRNAITLLVGCFFAACSNAPGSVSLAGKGGTGVALSAAAGGFVISSPLTFDKTNIVLGDTLNGSVTYTNTSSGSIALQHVVIVAGLSPGVTDPGPYYDLTPSLGAQTIAPGGTVTLNASRAFSATDPTGSWYAFATYQDASGAWYKGTSVNLTVVPPPAPPPAGGFVISTPLTLDKTNVVAGDTLHGTVTYQNTSSSPISIGSIAIGGRPPGGTNGAGPYYDLTPQLAAQTVPPGATVTLAASRVFAATDLVGQWYTFATYKDAGGVWHDGPSVNFTATAAPPAPAGVVVTVAPSAPSTTPGGTINFQATVTGTTAGQSTAATWSVVAGGGIIDPTTGVYVAPGTPGAYAVTAASVADPTKTDIANVVVFVPGSNDATGLIPPDRLTTWKPGAPGGIPSVTAIYTTIDAATYGNGTTNATAAINAAIQNAGAVATVSNRQVVYLPAGTYLISSPINLNVSNVVLRGAGPALSKIIGNPGGPAIRFGIFWPNYSAPVNVVSDNPKGATSITVADASAIQVGDVLQIDIQDDKNFVNIQPDSIYRKRQPTSDVNGPGTGGAPGVTGGPWRSIGQQVEVASKNGNVLGLSGVLHLAFPLSQVPQVFKTATARAGEPGTRYTGLEDLYVSGGSNDNIVLLNTAYSWVKNIESDGRPLDANHGMSGQHVNLIHAYRCEIRDSYFHHARVINQGGGAYGISIANSSSDNLVENNISVHLNKPVVMNNSGGGNVIAYNYVDNAYSTSFAGWQESAIDGNHECFSHSDLFEGNWAANIGSDSTHGNDGWQTFFRNYAAGRNSAPPSPDTGNVRAVGVDGYNREHTFVGNVLGNGTQTLYDSTSTATLSAATVYRTGANALGGSYDTLDNGTALRLLFRHANFDSVSNAVVYDPTVARHDLPNSLYLTGKPGFFGSLAWPWVDPAGTTRVSVLPAKQRFDTMP